MKHFYAILLAAILILGACDKYPPDPATFGNNKADHPTVPQTVPSPTHTSKGNSKIKSFSRSKTILFKLYKQSGRQTTFYCGCGYQDRKIDHAGCNYIPKNSSDTRAHRVEWEHVVPASLFGRKLKAWKEGHPECERKGKRFKGRKCAKKTSAEFRLMEADLYNLVPAIGEVNKYRSNYSMALIPGEARQYGDCDVEMKKGEVEPTERIRGDIARIYFYMNSAYPEYDILGENRTLFEAWDKVDPVDKWECERAGLIEGAQGNENPFVKKPCVEKGWR